ncbi:MAG: undecaprenyl-diphosphatase [Thermodesulfobacteriota bacterium]|nr:undecaprenyl-diphosphatase [Thermodesulfobacteriota bacterium]
MMESSLNIEIFKWIHAGAGTRPVVDGLAVFFGEGGPYFLAVLFAVLWFFVDENKKTALLEATEAAVVGLLINQLIGLLYFHPRPYMVGLCTPLFPHGPETSFPSDHATLLFTAAFYLLFARRWTACGAPLLVIALLTAWGRVYGGIHFPFDMAGSLVVGLISVGLMSLLVKRLHPLNGKLIRIADQLRGRFIRTKNNRARES